MKITLSITILIITALVLSYAIMCEKVEVRDIKTGKFSVVLKKNLGEEMILVENEKSGKKYWVNRYDLIQSGYRHPPFSGEIKQRLLTLMNTFSEVSKFKNYEKWEDGFRRDNNPEREIKVWEYIAKQYKKFSPKYKFIEEKLDIYYLLITCSSSKKDIVLQTTKLNKLSVDDAKIIINSYYSK